MQRKLLALVTLALCSSLANAATNVALGGSVVLEGADFGNSGGWSGSVLAAPATVTDGALLPIGQQWNIDTVFWSGALGADTIKVTLPTTAIISHIDLQADNNDDYGISYRDVGGIWHSLTTISPHRSWGLDMGSASFANVTATALAITAVGGDGYYSVSELQVIGAPVPEPESYAMVLAGLAACGVIMRRRMQG